jgi:hypothetical protein
MTDMEAMNQKQAAAYLWRHHLIRLEPVTLANLRGLKKGPAYLKRGKFVLYTQDALDAFAATRMPAQGTSQ